MAETTTIHQAIDRFIENVALSRSENTARTYQNGLNTFLEMLEEMEIDSYGSISLINENFVSLYARYLKSYSPATENLYINIFKNFLEYLIAEKILQLNMYQIKLLIHQRIRKPGIRLPQFPLEAIGKVILYAQETLPTLPCKDSAERLINLRDSAFLLTLADTGLRIHEICALRRGDVDWFKKKAIIIGKGNKEAIIRFSERSIMSMRNYLNERGALDGAGSSHLSSFPIFARHDKGAGKKTLPITTKTGRLIVSRRVAECLGEAHPAPSHRTLSVIIS